MNLVEMQTIKKSFNGVIAIREVNVNVGQNEVVGLLGV